MKYPSPVDRTEQYKKMLLDIIVKKLPTARIILFGSRARGDNKEGSDIDIALDNGTKIDPRVIIDIKGLIEDSDLPLFCDVVDIHAISDSMREKILTGGVVWKN